MKSKGWVKVTLLLASMVTMMSGAIVAPSLPQIKQVFIEVDNIELLSRLIITLPALFIAFFSPLFGWLSDRLGRKKLLLFALILYALSGTSGFFLDNIYAILVGRAFLGIAVGGIMTIILALIGDYFTGDERNRFTGMQGAFMGIGGIVFISIAGVLADVQWQTPFLIYLFSIPVLILAILYLHEPERVNSGQRRVKSDGSYSKPQAWLIYVLGFLGIIFFYMVPVQVPFILDRIEGISNAQIGFAISLSTLSAAMISMNYQRIKKILSFKQIYQFAMLFMGLGYLIISQVSGYWPIMGGLFVAGLGIGLFMPTCNLWMMDVAPDQIRGTMLGRLSMAMFIGQFLSPVIFQPIVSHFTVVETFLIAAIGMGVVIIVLFVFSEKKAKITG